jgi:hypothetical protein
VEYRFYLEQGITMQQVGQTVQIPGVEKESIGYFLPLSRWPEGNYRIQVMVTDRFSGAGAFREAAFRIVAGEDSPQVTSQPNSH